MTTGRPPLPIAVRIARAREKLKLTQAELAGKLDVNKRNVERWEAGEVIPSPRHVVGLAYHLGLDRDALEKQASVERFERTHPHEAEEAVA